MMGDNDFMLGRLAEATERLAKGQDEIFERLGNIEQQLAEKKGERRATGWMLGAAGGAVGAVVTALARFLAAKHS